jgi:hypothetical protein
VIIPLALVDRERGGGEFLEVDVLRLLDRDAHEPDRSTLERSRRLVALADCVAVVTGEVRRYPIELSGRRGGASLLGT